MLKKSLHLFRTDNGRAVWMVYLGMVGKQSISYAEDNMEKHVLNHSFFIDGSLNCR